MRLVPNEYNELVLSPFFKVHKNYLGATLKEKSDTQTFFYEGIHYFARKEFVCHIWTDGFVTVEVKVDETTSV